MKRNVIMGLVAVLLLASGLLATRSPASEAPGVIAEAYCSLVVVELDPGYSVSRTHQHIVCK